MCYRAPIRLRSHAGERHRFGKTLRRNSSTNGIKKPKKTQTRKTRPTHRTLNRKKTEPQRSGPVRIWLWTLHPQMSRIWVSVVNTYLLCKRQCLWVHWFFAICDYGTLECQTGPTPTALCLISAIRVYSRMQVSGFGCPKRLSSIGLSPPRPFSGLAKPASPFTTFPP